MFDKRPVKVLDYVDMCLHRWDEYLSRKFVYLTYFDEADIRPNSVDDLEELISVGHVHADAQVTFLPLDYFEQCFGCWIGMLCGTLGVCLCCNA